MTTTEVAEQIDERAHMRAKDPSKYLPEAWEPLRPTPGQMRYVRSKARFNVVPAGRRSGKTARLKRKVAYRALNNKLLRHNKPGRFFLGAPVRDQVKRIYWHDMKELTRPWWSKRPSESELTIWLLNGAEIVLIGMDKPQRFEGQPWDGGGLDEYADMKPNAWEENVRPALSDREGWCDFIGVPGGRNHYYKLYQRALADMLEFGAQSEWAAHTWFSSEVLSAKEIASAKRDMDLRIFEQEYEASFINFTGRTYYGFTDDNKARCRHLYNLHAPLIIMLDFNVAPGVAAVGQWVRLTPLGAPVFAVFGEVWIPDNSNTELVCTRLCADWGQHQGWVEVYGDATGGQRRSSALMGTDWHIVKRVLSDGMPMHNVTGFGTRRVLLKNKRENPSERDRVNAMNSFLCNAEGKRRLLVDPATAPRVVQDFEGVQNVEGGSGEIDKDKDPKLTHLTDGIGYFVEAHFPVSGPNITRLKVRT